VVDKVNNEKLRLTAIEAAEQCERLSIPIIHEMQSLDKALASRKFTGKLYWCDESGSGNNFATSIITNISDNAILLALKVDLTMMKGCFLHHKSLSSPSH